MTALGFALLLIGAILVVAEAHVPSGVLGVLAAAALIAGAVIVIGSVGASEAIAVPVGVALGAAAGSRRVRVQAGAESLCGHVGVVRRWSESAGQVFVDGALWRARDELAEADDEALQEGDPVVVERVSGLTLSVRRAEEWELIL
jgi:membrane protein implicated in regulation of membrane protease activity